MAIVRSRFLSRQLGGGSVETIQPADNGRTALLLIPPAGGSTVYVAFGIDPGPDPPFGIRGIPLFPGAPPVLMRQDDLGTSLKQPLRAWAAAAAVVQFVEARSL